MASIVQSFAILGVDGYLVDVEVKEIEGQPMISIVGLGDTAVKESKERIQAVINDSAGVKNAIVPLTFTINLLPN